MSADVLGDMAASLLVHVVTGMTAAGVAPPARQIVTHGPPVEEITDGGCVEQLAVYWTSLQSSIGPTQPGGPGGQQLRAEPGTTLVTFVVELVRCAPTFTDAGQVPSAAALVAAAEDGARDGWTLHHLLRLSPKRAPTMFGAATTGCDVRDYSGVVSFPPRGGVQGVVGQLVTQVDLNLGSIL